MDTELIVLISVIGVVLVFTTLAVCVYWAKNRKQSATRRADGAGGWRDQSRTPGDVGGGDGSRHGVVRDAAPPPPPLEPGYDYSPAPEYTHQHQPTPMTAGMPDDANWWHAKQNAVQTWEDGTAPTDVEWYQRGPGFGGEAHRGWGGGGHIPMVYRPSGDHIGYRPPVSKEQLAKTNDLITNGYITPSQMMLRDPDIPMFDEDGNINTLRNRYPMFFEARPDIIGGVHTLPDGTRRVRDIAFDLDRNDPDIDPYQYHRDYPGYLPHAPPGYKRGWSGNVQTLSHPQDAEDHELLQPLMGGNPVQTRSVLKPGARHGRQPASLENAMDPNVIPDLNIKRDSLPPLPVPSAGRGRRPPPPPHQLRGAPPRTFSVPTKEWEQELEQRRAELRAEQEARLAEGYVDDDDEYDEDNY